MAGDNDPITSGGTVNPPSESIEPKRATEDISHIERVLSSDSHNAEENLKGQADLSRVDKEVQQYASMGHIEIDEETNKRLLRKIDRRVLTFMVATYFLQAIDKGTLSFTSIMNIRQDTHLVGQQYSWLTTCIYIAVLIVEYPTNWVIQRVPIAKYLGFNVICWGIVLACHAACTNFTGLVTVRTLLGIFEACCQPSFVILSGMWYKREEQAARVAYWYMMNGGQQIVGGLLAYCFSLIGNGHAIKSWQAIFLTYGCISVLYGIVLITFMPDSPMRAKCFTEEEKHLMVERVRSNRTGLQNRQFRAYQVKEALLDPQTWGYCAIQIFTTLPTSGLGSFANIIITSLDFTVLQTQLLAMVLGAYIIIVLLTSTWLVNRYHQNLLVMAVYLIPSFAGTIVLMTVVNHNKGTQVGLLISYYLTLSFWSAQTLTLSMVSRNIAGQTKKASVVAATFISWAAGNAVGPQVFLARDAPRYFIAFSVHLVCYSLMLISILALRWWLKRENARKDKLKAELGDDPNMVHAFEDRTDRENVHFRYVY
ncbi:Major facilitator superfamily domain, general substrate transporter [Penicillium occitanis (nom. inval.)]|nr:hypothetical protein PENOC_067360 [Penicillium occitanis (nom. inval.)]PCH08241.1 Major facilitator superfamily domain, general substrate transporter [Penicillium occitanis (nom. inval.)]